MDYIDRMNALRSSDDETVIWAAEYIDRQHREIRQLKDGAQFMVQKAADLSRPAYDDQQKRLLD